MSASWSSIFVSFVVVQWLSHTWLFATLWIAACQASLTCTTSLNLIKLMSTESVMPSNHLILCHPFSSSLQFFPAPGYVLMIQLFTSGGSKHWSFSISPSNEISGLISFRIDWFDVLTVQGTLKSLLQHQSLKASILQCSTFFMVQLSNPYRTTEKISSQDLGRWIEKWIIARWVNIWCWKLILLVLVWGHCVTSMRWRSFDCKASWFYTAYKMKIWVLIVDCYLGDL